MKEKRRMEVLFETHEITTVSFRRNKFGAVFCRLCQTETIHVTIPEAAAISKSAESSILRSINLEQIHSSATATGALLICGPSLKLLPPERL